MAIETLLEGTEFEDTDLTLIDPHLLALMDLVVEDTEDGSAVVTSFDDAPLIVGTGADGEVQGALVPTDEAVAGTITNGEFALDVSLPANAGLAFEGRDTIGTGAEGAEFFGSLIDTAFMGQSGDEANSLQQAIRGAVDAVVDPDVLNSVVHYVSVLENSDGPGPATIELSGADNATTNEVLALNLNNVNAGTTVMVDNVDKIVVVGTGTLQVGDGIDAVVAGDARDQTLIGGDGNDALWAGGGTDILIGGGGDNTFGINGDGNVTINDLDEGDTVLFALDGIETLDDLRANLSSVTYTDGDTVATFVNGSTVTMVGVNPEDLTADMFAFATS